MKKITKSISITIVIVMLSVILCSCGKTPQTVLSVKLDFKKDVCEVFDVTVEYMTKDKAVFKASEKAASVPFQSDTLLFILPDDVIGDEENLKSIDVVIHLYDKNKGQIDMERIKAPLKYGKTVKVGIKGTEDGYSFQRA